ncbi:MAG TPA: sigma-70 family RNA polymerase sigma factor [Phycisphaerae bacterium]|nr:sigma-70 family RNA polymerase sigma factor [Phycisphaerae bacterium]
MNLERLYQEAGPSVWSYLRRRIADSHAAEELLQETFLAAAADPAKLAAAVSERAWLIGIARNLVREHTRHERRRLRPLDVGEAPTVEPQHEDRRLEAMREAIARLPDGQREVLDLRLGQELSYGEIAEALQIPIGTVRSRMHNAVNALRRWAQMMEGQKDPRAATPGERQPQPENER